MSGPLVELIPAALDGERVDRVVSLLAGVQPQRRPRRSIDGRRGDARRGVVDRRASSGVPGRPDAGGRRRASCPSRRCPRPTRPSRSTVVHEDDDVVVVDKPAGLVVHPGAGQRRRHARQRAARPLPGDRRRRRARTGPASCTASTAARPGCWSWPGRQQAYARPGRRAGGPRGRAAGTRRWCGACPRPPTASSTRRSAARRATRTRMAVVAGGKDGPHPLRGARPLDRSRSCAAAATAGWRRPHPPDPGPPAAIGHPVVGDRRLRRRAAPTPRRSPAVPPRRPRWPSTTRVTGERAGVHVAAARRPGRRARQAQLG